MLRPGSILLASLMICGSAFAAPPGPDRSNLSYEENVLINTACAKMRPRGDAAYYGCVTKQVAELQAHPVPDRSSLTSEQRKVVDQRCQYLRRVDVAQYHDCVAQAMSRPQELTGVPSSAQASAPE